MYYVIKFTEYEINILIESLQYQLDSDYCFYQIEVKSLIRDLKEAKPDA